jgi:L,D-transpeptidase ErfK/SrfK
LAIARIVPCITKPPLTDLEVRHYGIFPAREHIPPNAMHVHWIDYSKLFICQVMVMKDRSRVFTTALAGLACVLILAYGNRFAVPVADWVPEQPREQATAGGAVASSVATSAAATAAATATAVDGAVVPAASVKLAGGASSKEPGVAGSACECPDVHKLWFEDPPMVGHQVSDLQEGLAVAGFYRGAVDGVFGRATQQAVLGFQASAGLPETGVADMTTWMALGRACEPVVEAMLRREDPSLEQQLAKADAGVAAARMVLIDTSDLSLTVLENGLPIARFRVGIGEPETPTPLGQFVITDKAAWAGGFGTRWMGLNVLWGKFGIHGTNKPWTVGQRKSGGCVRMLNRDVEKLYALVGVGTPVMITAGHFGTFGTSRPRITPGWKGSMVFEIQRRLIRMGYLEGPADGAYGPNSERAVMRLQRDKGLPVTGEVDEATYRALGLEIID